MPVDHQETTGPSKPERGASRFAVFVRGLVQAPGSAIESIRRGEPAQTIEGDNSAEQVSSLTTVAGNIADRFGRKVIYADPESGGYAQTRQMFLFGADHKPGNIAAQLDPTRRDAIEGITLKVGKSGRSVALKELLISKVPDGTVDVRVVTEPTRENKRAQGVGLSSDRLIFETTLGPRGVSAKRTTLVDNPHGRDVSDSFVVTAEGLEGVLKQVYSILSEE